MSGNNTNVIEINYHLTILNWCIRLVIFYVFGYIWKFCKFPGCTRYGYKAAS